MFSPVCDKYWISRNTYISLISYQDWATDMRKSISVCFSDSRICNICRQTFLPCNICIILFFNRTTFQIFVFHYFRVLCKCCSTCYSFFNSFSENAVPFYFIVLITKSKQRFCESLWDLNWIVLIHSNCMYNKFYTP